MATQELNEHLKELAERRIGATDFSKDLIKSRVDIEISDLDYRPEIFLESLKIYFCENMKMSLDDFDKIKNGILNEAKASSLSTPRKGVIVNRFYDKEDKTEFELKRVYAIIYKEKSVSVIIQGSLPVEGKDGWIDSFSFNSEDIPGKILQDGRIDYYELNKYPAVAEKAMLFSIWQPIQGKPGISSQGNLLPIKKYREYEIKIISGISLTEIKDEDDQMLIRHDAYSDITGVLVLSKDDEKKIRSAEVVSEFVISENIGLKTGRLGDGHEESYFPVPVKLTGKILTGGAIYCDYDVLANEVCGGIIKGRKKITIKRVSEKSVICTEGDILVAYSQNSSLVAKGKITVLGELIDSEIECREIFISGNPKRIAILNLHAEIDKCGSITDAIFRGKNTIILAQESLKRYVGIRGDIEKKKQRIDSIKKDLAVKMDELNKCILNIKAKVNDDIVQKYFSDYPKNFIAVCENIDKMGINDMIAVQKIINGYTVLKKIIEERKQEEKYLGDLLSEESMINEMVAGIKFELSGILNPGSVIDFYFMNTVYSFSEKKSGVANRLDVFFYYNTQKILDITDKSMNIEMISRFGK